MQQYIVLEKTCFRLRAAGHHMPHILCKFHEPFIDKILLPSLSRFTGSSSICFSFSYPKIYISHCICRQHTSSATDSFKSKFSLNTCRPRSDSSWPTLECFWFYHAVVTMQPQHTQACDAPARCSVTSKSKVCTT